MITRNKDLFYQVADKIEKYPELYNQRNYGTYTYCGTAHCIAGWVASILEYYPTRINFFGGDVYGWGNVCQEPGVHENSVEYNVRNIDELAEEKLGITFDEARTLFSSRWGPKNDMTVPQALRHFGDGGEIV